MTSHRCCYGRSSWLHGRVRYQCTSAWKASCSTNFRCTCDCGGWQSLHGSLCAYAGRGCFLLAFMLAYLFLHLRLGALDFVERKWGLVSLADALFTAVDVRASGLLLRVVRALPAAWWLASQAHINTTAPCVWQIAFVVDHYHTATAASPRLRVVPNIEPATGTAATNGTAGHADADHGLGQASAHVLAAAGAGYSSMAHREDANASADPVAAGTCAFCRPVRVGLDMRCMQSSARCWRRCEAKLCIWTPFDERTANRTHTEKRWHNS